MFSLFAKEIKSFFGSLIGYLVIAVFLLVTGLFLWVFPGQYNVPETGYSSLEGLFNLAPWLYLFLVPAITMRLFAEEKRSGTIELLLTHPISDFKMVSAKFLAGLFLVVFSLVPTLLYFISVYYLGNPIGNIDIGATWGSFIGLFLLATIYVAIGVFMSSRTDSQIVSFILSMVISFLFYLGFEFIASSGVGYLVERLFTWLSINEHYLSVSRGVVDLRDICYFLGMTFLFLYLTAVFLRKGKIRSKTVKFNLAKVLVIWIVIFVGSANFLARYDLTSDKRYSLSGVSKQVAYSLEQSVEVELFLAGELEPGLRKLQNEILEKIAVLNAYSGKPIRVKVNNPYSILDQDKRDEFIEGLIGSGVKPVNLRKKTDKGEANRFIFPGAIVRMGDKQLALNFLKNNRILNYENNFNHSIETVEFELVNGLRKLSREKVSTVAFLQGHGEANQYELSDIAMSLSADFNVEMVELDDLRTKSVDILVIADPEEVFDERSKIQIDQYFMKGGKLVWLIDPVHVSLDSLSRGETTYSFPKDLGLGDLLFSYGVRLNYDLLQDVDCIRIQVNTAAPGNQPRYTLHPWYYSPLLSPADHPIGKNLNRIMSEFVSSIDTVSGSSQVSKEVILSTSAYARKVKSPSSVSLRNIDNPPARELFTLSNIPVGLLLEGKFASPFRNRMVEKYGFSSAEVIPESKETKMLVFSDGGLIKNKVRYSTNPPQIMELGKDRTSGLTFGNKDFLINAIHYLDDGAGIMQLRGRTMQLRLLDKVKLRDQKPLWQWVNIAIPLLLLGLFGLMYNLRRIHKYKRG